MLSIVALVTLSVALAGCSAVKWREDRFATAGHVATLRRRVAAMAVPIIYVPLLIIAARFGARTFPGIWTPNNPLLNEITQGGIFYLAAAAAIICGIVDLFQVILSRSTTEILRRSMLWGKRVMLTGVVLVCLYGFMVAIDLQRLP